MSSITPIAGLQVPSLSDSANIVTAISPLASAVDTMLIPRYATLAVRNTSITAPVAGMVCYVAATDEVYIYRASTWQSLVPRTKYKTATTTIPDTATIGDIPEMSMSVEADSRYILRGMLRISSTGTEDNDIKMDWTKPVGAGGFWRAMGADTAISTNFAGSVMLGENAFGGVGPIIIGTLTTNAQCIDIVGVLETASTAGTFQFQAAEGTAIGGASAILIHVSSWFSLQKIG